MRQSFQFLKSSVYLRLICTIVLGYGLTSNFTESIWKSLLKKEKPDPLQYQAFMGNFSTAVGVCTCIVTFFGANLICILGWRIAAMATPTLMAILAAPFFGYILLGLDRPDHLHLAVTIGTVQTLLYKTSRNVLFDPTTQIAYIPLDEETRVKGKAAIDTLCSRLGKGGSAFIQQMLLLVFRDIIGASPAIALIFYSVVLIWILAVNKLSDLFM